MKRILKKLFYLIILSVLVFASYSFCQSNATLQLLPGNPHYFLYKNKPLVIVGSGEHYGAVMNTAFNYDVYLKTLKKDGLNTTRLFMGAYYEKPGAFGIERNTMAPQEPLVPWKKNNGKYDLTQWDQEYFTRLHDFMNKALQNDVIVEINLFSSYYGAGWSYHPFNGNNNVNYTPVDLPFNLVNTLENGSILTYQEAYVRKLVKELNQYDNFYFEIQNEPWADQKDTVLVWNDFLGKEDLIQPGNNWKNTLEVPSEKSISWHKKVYAWITEEEKSLPKKHLISHNMANFKMPVFVKEPAVSVYTFHYAYPEAVTLNYQLNKVIGFNETGFAGNKDDTYRRQAWRFMMSGGGLFNHLDYSFTVGHEEGTDTANKAPGGGSPTLRKYFSYLKKYFDALNLQSLRPDTDFLVHTEGAFTYPMKDAKSWIVYIEPLLSKPAILNLKLPAGKYVAEWTDVKTGEKIRSEKLNISLSGFDLISPGGATDKVVKLKYLR